MQLLKIGNKDFTQFIKAPSYKVNRHDEYAEWTDANFITHRYFKRTRISGTCTMLFTDKDDYYGFLDINESLKVTGGYIPDCEVYCANLHRTFQADLYIDFDPPEAVPIFGESFEGFEVTIIER